MTDTRNMDPQLKDKDSVKMDFSKLILYIEVPLSLRALIPFLNT